MLCSPCPLLHSLYLMQKEQMDFPHILGLEIAFTLMVSPSDFLWLILFIFLKRLRKQQYLLLHRISFAGVRKTKQKLDSNAWKKNRKLCLGYSVT